MVAIVPGRYSGQAEFSECSFVFTKVYFPFRYVSECSSAGAHYAGWVDARLYDKRYGAYRNAIDMRGGAAGAADDDDDDDDDDE